MLWETREELRAAGGGGGGVGGGVGTSARGVSAPQESYVYSEGVVGDGAWGQRGFHVVVAARE